MTTIQNTPTGKPHSVLDSARQRLKEILFRQVDPSSLAVFRILFGGIMLWEVLRYWDAVPALFFASEFHFHYELTPWIKPLSRSGMNLVFAIMAAGAAGILLGAFYRVYSALFFLTFTYFFLLEQAKYLNHFYLICLLSFLLLILKTERWASIDRLWSKNAQLNYVPFWNILILRAQIVIVYFYAGIAKLNYDWLHGEPFSYWLSKRVDYSLITWFIEHDWARLWFFNYGGLLFDLLIGPALLWKRTRILALIPLCVFHFGNAYLFSIGAFPWIMLATTILFFEPSLPRTVWERVLRFTRRRESKEFSESDSIGGSVRRLYKNTVIVFLTLWIFFQLSVPLRHFFYPSSVHWTEEGHRFAWRMKLRSKRGALLYVVQDRASKSAWLVDPSEELTARQLKKLSTRPYLILLYAHHIRDTLKARGMKQPIVKALSYASLNGRPFQVFVDPDVDLSETSYPLFAHATWILPLKHERNIGKYEPFQWHQFKQNAVSRVRKLQNPSSDSYGSSEIPPPEQTI